MFEERAHFDSIFRISAVFSWFIVQNKVIEVLYF